MMRLIGIVIIVILFTLGIYKLLSSYLNIPTSASENLILSYDKNSSVKHRGINSFLANKIMPYVKLDKYKREKYVRALSLNDRLETPEMYISNLLSNSLVLGVLGILTWFAMPPLAISIIFIAVYRYFTNIKKIFKKLDEQQVEINKELLAFLYMIKEEMLLNSNVPKIIKNYANYAGKSFKLELNTTINLMKKGEIDYALLDLERRIGSICLSNVVKTLININHGSKDVFQIDMQIATLEDFSENEMERVAESKMLSANGYMGIYLGIMMLFFCITIAYFAYVSYAGAL